MICVSIIIFGQKERNMKSYIRLLAVLFLTGISGHAIANGLSKSEITFKGIRFDKPGEMEKVKQMCLETPELDAQYHKYQRFPSNCEAEPNSNDYGLDQVYFNTSFGSLENGMQFTKGENDTLIGVSIFSSSERISTLVEALKAKYGKPKVNPVLLEMGNGAKVTREIMIWIDSRGTVMKLNTAAESASAKADLRYGRLSIESARLRTIKAKMKDEVTSAIKDNL